MARATVNIYLTFHRGILDLRFGPENLEALRKLGNVMLNQTDKAPTTEQLIGAARDCEVILSERLTPGEAKLFDDSPRLIAFVRSVTDLRQVDVDAASRNGILVTTVDAAFVPAVVEWTVGQMINLGRFLPQFIMTYRAGRIPELSLGRQGRQLAGKTAGIVGFGRLGRRLAEVLGALGMRVLVFDPYVGEWPGGVEATDLDTLAKESDYVVSLAPYTTETENMMNAAVFQQMKTTAFLVNPSRGGLIDEKDLETALTEGWIAGAALDVGREPGDIPPLRLGRLANVFATPHVAAGFESNLLQGRQAVEAVAEILAGRTPEGALNAPHATRMGRLPSGRC